MSEPSLHTTDLVPLVERGRRGDREAQDQLIRRAWERLERMARAMLHRFPNVRRRVETGDVLQNSLVRLLRALEKVEPTSTREFFALAAAQIRRELLDLARHFKARGLLLEQDLPEVRPQGAAFDVVDTSSAATREGEPIGSPSVVFALAPSPNPVGDRACSPTRTLNGSTPRRAHQGCQASRWGRIAKRVDGTSRTSHAGGGEPGTPLARTRRRGSAACILTIPCFLAPARTTPWLGPCLHRTPAVCGFYPILADAGLRAAAVRAEAHVHRPGAGQRRAVRRPGQRHQGRLPRLALGLEAGGRRHPWEAVQVIRQAREATRLLTSAGLIPAPPEAGEPS
jgi:hypothetical protein